VFTDTCRSLSAKSDTEDVLTTTWLDAADKFIDNIVIRQKRQPGKYSIVYRISYLANISGAVAMLWIPIINKLHFR